MLKLERSKNISHRMILTVNSELFSNEGGFLNVKTINIKIYFKYTSRRSYIQIHIEIYFIKVCSLQLILLLIEKLVERSEHARKNICKVIFSTYYFTNKC